VGGAEGCQCRSRGKRSTFRSPVRHCRRLRAPQSRGHMPYAPRQAAAPERRGGRHPAGGAPPPARAHGTSTSVRMLPTRVGLWVPEPMPASAPCCHGGVGGRGGTAGGERWQGTRPKHEMLARGARPPRVCRIGTQLGSQCKQSRLAIPGAASHGRGGRCGRCDCECLGCYQHRGRCRQRKHGRVAARAETPAGLVQPLPAPVRRVLVALPVGNIVVGLLLPPVHGFLHHLRAAWRVLRCCGDAVILAQGRTMGLWARPCRHPGRGPHHKLHRVLPLSIAPAAHHELAAAPAKSMSQSG